MAAREDEYRVQRLRGGSFTWYPTGIWMLQLMAQVPGTIVVDGPSGFVSTAR